MRVKEGGGGRRNLFTQRFIFLLMVLSRNTIKLKDFDTFWMSCWFGGGGGMKPLPKIPNLLTSQLRPKTKLIESIWGLGKRSRRIDSRLKML